MTTTIQRDDLAWLRRSERWLGLHTLGVPQPAVVSLGVQDGRVQLQQRALFERLMSLLQPTDVVVSTWENDGSNLRRHIRPLLGRKVANTVTKAEAAKAIRDITVGKTAAQLNNAIR